MKKAALVKDKNGFWEIYKPVLEARNYEVILLNLFFDADQKILLNEDWDLFIWRAKHNPKERNPAKKIINLMSSQRNVKSYPDSHSFWHFDDKIAQHYVFSTNKIPTPETYIFYDKDNAIEFASTADYPIIHKASTGAGSSNVGLFKNKKEAIKHINKAFGKGIKTFFQSDVQHDYVYFQKFAKGNAGDYRLICFGNRIEGFFRNNRKDEPFASGSYDFNLKELPEDLLEFIFNINTKLNYNVMSYDIIKDGDDWVVTEISVVYGDLKDNVYNTCLKYVRTDSGKWQKYSSEENHHITVLNYILDKWERNA